MRRALALNLLLVLGAAPVLNSDALAATIAAPRLRALISAESHHPRIGSSWWYQVRVTNQDHKPVACRIHLQFFFNGSPVGEVGVHTVKNGLWRETIPARGPDAFPLASVGQPLVLRATVTARGYPPATAGWKITVEK